MGLATDGGGERGRRGGRRKKQFCHFYLQSLSCAFLMERLGRSGGEAMTSLCDTMSCQRLGDCGVKVPSPSLSPSVFPSTHTSSPGSQAQAGERLWTASWGLMVATFVISLQEQFPLRPGSPSQGSTKRPPSPEVDPLSTPYTPPSISGAARLPGDRVPLQPVREPRKMWSQANPCLYPKPAASLLCDNRQVTRPLSAFTSPSLGGTHSNSQWPALTQSHLLPPHPCGVDADGSPNS